MKTPEEIKKGLECCGNDNTFICPDECPYIGSAIEGHGCAVNMSRDALAYIKQLEAQNAELVRKIEQLQRERDAAVKDISLGSRCAACKMFFHNGGRCSGGIYCIPMNFEWRGVQEKEEEHEVDSH